MLESYREKSRQKAAFFVKWGRSHAEVKRSTSGRRIGGSNIDPDGYRLAPVLIKNRIRERTVSECVWLNGTMTVKCFGPSKKVIKNHLPFSVHNIAKSISSIKICTDCCARLDNVDSWKSLASDLLSCCEGTTRRHLIVERMWVQAWTPGPQRSGTVEMWRSPLCRRVSGLWIWWKLVFLALKYFFWFNNMTLVALHLSTALIFSFLCFFL